MTDPLGTDEGEQSTGGKENFVGRVTHSEVNCECEDCEKGREAAADADWDSDRDVDHLYTVEPLTEYDKDLKELGINTSSSYDSKWMVFLSHLEGIHGPLGEQGVESLEDLTEFLVGRVYEFRDITWTEDEEINFSGTEYSPTYEEVFADSDFEPNSLMLPVREVTDEDELRDLGVEADASEVEEVDGL